MKQRKVEFAVVESVPQASASGSGRLIVFLTPDNWDDFGFVTTYHLVVRGYGEKDVEVGVTKILERHQKYGRPELPARFTQLSDDFCSLGQSFAFYEILHAMGELVWKPILSGLRDMVVDPVVHDSFSDEPGFTNSLTRSSGAERALEDAPSLFIDDRLLTIPGTKLTMSFRTSLGGSPVTIPLDFNGSSDIPERWLVIIGYNGSGKTRLLANIGMIASRLDSELDEKTRRRYGYFESDRYNFGAIIALSYSAFDTFEIPQFSRQEEEQKLRRGYFYCGLRKRRTHQNMGLKSIEELFKDFSSALDLASNRDLRKRFISAIRLLLQEPSLSQYRAMYELIENDEQRRKHFFDSLSTGHKLVLNVVTQLIAKLQPKSLVLFDEPESHLHPSLLSAMLKTIRLLLDETDSFCIFATHSPVLLQETPTKQVLLVRRSGHRSMVERPDRETFGENVGALTSEVFNLAASETDFHYVLDRLAKKYDIQAIENIFGRPLGLQARSFIRSIRTGER